MFQHRTEVCVCHCQANHCQDCQQCIEVVRDRSDEQIQTIHAFYNAGYSSSPGRDRSDDTDRSSCCVDQVRQFCSGNFVCVCYRSHNGTYCQTVEVVIYEDQTAQQGCTQHSTSSCFECGSSPSAVCSRTACFVHQGNDDTQNNQENQDTYVPAVGQFCQHTAVCVACEDCQVCQFGIKVRIEQSAYYDTDEQGRIYFLCDQCQNDRYQWRYQRPCCCIHVAYVFSFCFTAEYSCGHGDRYQSNYSENAKPFASEVSFFVHNLSPFRNFE